MAEKTLFILAGYTAVGKTTLTVHALRKKIPLFGKEYDHLFQSFKIPSTIPETRLSTEEKLIEGCWLNWDDTHNLRQMANLPEHMLLHLDLVSFVTPAKHVISTEALGTLLPRSSSSLANNSHNEMFAKDAIRRGFFSKFDRIIINTLYAPWEVIKKHWDDRRKSRGNRKDKRNRGVLFDQEDPGKKIHQSIYSTWLLSTSVLKPEFSLLSEVKDGKVMLGRIRAGSAYPTLIRTPHH